MLSRVLSFGLRLIKKVFRYYVDRLSEAIPCCLRIIWAAMVNGAIMVPLCVVSGFVLSLMGYNMALPADLPGSIPQDVKSLALLFLMVGLFEETYFRYLIQDCMFTRYFRFPDKLSWVLASVLFGAMHLANPGTLVARLPQAIGATGAGFWFGHLYKKHGLWFAILVHGLYDFTLVYLSIRFHS